MHAHEIDYKILGESIQVAEIILDPGEAVIAEAGAMLYMDDGIRFETKMGDGSEPNQGFLGKLVSAGARVISGESVFVTRFTNDGASRAKVAFAAPFPGSIIPLDLSQLYNNQVVVQKDAFLCAALGTKISISMSKKLGAGLFGEGFVFQKLSGDGMAFMHAGGMILEKQLDNETLRVDTGCLVGMESSVDYSIDRAGGLKSMLFGGEGLFLTTLKGSGKVWLQSLPLGRLVETIGGGGKNKDKGEGSAISDFLE
ncbi:TIGR00266 family protein [Roseivirga sp. BDSF3-8]|uniref:TIGR00266 family protein n=1 Tax=Roseivirga sp. BDSF3-8 TaxID=3241598 RepID=UPI00353231CC